MKKKTKQENTSESCEKLARNKMIAEIKKTYVTTSLL